MQSDADAIALLRQRIRDAENTGDADAIVALMTDDVVAMVPSAPVLEGREACAAFVRETLAGLLEAFDRRVDYASAETTVMGDAAYDRGTFTIECLLREDGSRSTAAGKYLWLLRLEAGGWRIARLIHAVDDDGETPRAPETIETMRLRLTRPQLVDAGEMLARYAGDPEVTRYLGWATHTTLAHTEAFVGFSDSQWTASPAGPYLIWSRDDGRLLGSTGLAFDTPDVASTGYVLARDAWGRGYATEALGAMVELAGTLGIKRLQAVCHAEHATSRRVLEKRGFRVDEAATPDVDFPNLAPDVPRRAVLYVVEPRAPAGADT